MIYTLEFAQQCFERFNREIFNNSLPYPKFRLTNVRTYMGQMRRTSVGRLFCKKVIYTMKLNVRYNIEQHLAEDIIIHEMIHLCLWVRGIKDTSAHGTIFRETMNKINKTYGRNITISTHHTEDDPNPKRTSRNMVAVCQMTNGEMAITIPPKTKKSYFNHILKQSNIISDVHWYYTEDQFFAKYPHPRTVKIYYIDKVVLAKHLKEQDRME